MSDERLALDNDAAIIIISVTIKAIAVTFIPYLLIFLLAKRSWL